MKVRSAQTVFLQRLQNAGQELASLRPAQGFVAMFDFYMAEPADGCAVEADVDMLLFEWGTYNWGSGESFELNITRQWMAKDAADEEPWQLRLTFHFEPSGALRRLGAGNRWC